MLNRLTNLFSVSPNRNLAQSIFNVLQNQNIQLELIPILDSALNSAQPVEEQYNKRIAVCELIIYNLGLNHALAADVHDVIRKYKDDLKKYESKLWVRVKKCLGIA